MKAGVQEAGVEETGFDAAGLLDVFHTKLHELFGQYVWLEGVIGLSVLLLATLLVKVLSGYVTRKVIAFIHQHFTDNTRHGLLMDTELLARTAQMLPVLFFQSAVGLVPGLHPLLATVTYKGAMTLSIFRGVRVIDALLSAYLLTRQRRGKPGRSLKSSVQLTKLLVYGLGVVMIIAVLTDQQPLILLSGLGAASAVLLLVFRDTLLGFTAGLQLSSSDMLRVGDWIEMPQVGADGDVIDIALHTVKVQNFDKTITMIPTWRLMAESFRNFRGMHDAGGRRIKRTLRLDMTTVRFLEPDELKKLAEIELLEDYLNRKMGELMVRNEERLERLGPKRFEQLANQRRLTNIGTFRAYVLAYLRAHPGVHQNMSLMVRLMEPTPEGVPLELYCFTNTTTWAIYEGIQSDIFDHLIAIMPVFGLRLYQQPSGRDMRAAFGTMRYAGQGKREYGVDGAHSMEQAAGRERPM